jgi:hypothetical protein
VTKGEEAAYIQGSRAVWARMMQEAIIGLGVAGDGAGTAESWRLERVQIDEKLRELCRYLGGTPDWSGDLHLGDVIEKYILPLADALLPDESDEDEPQ